jgi:hypothetical protein
MSTLDERIARDCERSGVPFFVEDDALLDRVAGLLADDTLTLGTGLPNGSADPNSEGPGLTNRDLRNTTLRITEKVVAS